jgi:hypothetical protein
LSKDVVAFDKSRLPLGEIFKLESALGPRGADIVGQIAGVGEIVFHALGDSGFVRPANSLVRSRRGQPSLEPVNGSRVDYLEANPAVQTTALILEKYDDRPLRFSLAVLTSTIGEGIP